MAQLKYNSSSEVIGEVAQEYESLGDVGWKRKLEFIDDVGSLYHGPAIEGWITKKEDEIEEEIQGGVENLLESMVREEAKNLGDEKYEELYYEGIMDHVFLTDIARDIAYKLRVEDIEDPKPTAKEELDKAIQEKQSDILHQVQEEIKDNVETDVLTDTVRFMETPEETKRIETPTDPKKLENIPSEQGLGSITSKKNNRVKRGGKMLIKLFKLAQILDKKGEYELASEVDAIVKELSQRAGITPEEMISLANDLDAEGDTELADKLDVVLASKKKTKALNISRQKSGLIK